MSPKNHGIPMVYPCIYTHVFIPQIIKWTAINWSGSNWVAGSGGIIPGAIRWVASPMAWWLCCHEKNRHGTGKRTVCSWTWPSRNCGFTHEKWWFSIVILVYQRVLISAFQPRHLDVASRAATCCDALNPQEGTTGEAKAHSSPFSVSMLFLMYPIIQL